MTTAAGKLDDASISEAVLFLGMQALKRIASEWWHKLHLCQCDRGWFLEGIPCEIGKEELEAARAAELFAKWDALGLGYIGPKLRQ